jgi:DNA sulfur modification protein DndE
MKKKYAYCLFAVLVFGSAILLAGEKKQLKDYLTGLPFPMPEMKEPQFPDHTVSIVDFGAVADGYTLNTKAFADAIAACVKAGGGTVVVPPGTWLTGPIKLESNINLHVEKGALVQFSSSIHDFPFIAGFDGTAKKNIITPPVYAYHVNNIAITGEGIFDGAGEVWRYVKKGKMTSGQWRDLVASGGVLSSNGNEWWPSKEAMEGQAFLKEQMKAKKQLSLTDYEQTREYLRPDFVDLVQCTNILLDGPTFQNSPKFHLHPMQCENLIIRNVKVISPWYGQNTDGIDPGSSRNVVIYNCIVDVGDDGICLKPANIGPSQTPGPSCQNIVIADCVVYHAHGGFSIGSESYGGVKNVFVRNCTFIGTDVGLRFKSARTRGGLVERVFVDGIQMRNIATDAISFSMYYEENVPHAEDIENVASRKAAPVTNMTPFFRDFSIKNIVCNGAARGVVINGLPEATVNAITLDNVSIASAKGSFLADADSITFNNCRLLPKSGATITLIQSRNINVQHGSFPAVSDVFLNVVGEKSGGIKILGADIAAKKSVELGVDVKADAVKQE